MEQYFQLDTRPFIHPYINIRNLTPTLHYTQIYKNLTPACTQNRSMSTCASRDIEC